MPSALNRVSTVGPARTLRVSLGELAASDVVDLEMRRRLLGLIFFIGRGTGYWQQHAGVVSRFSPVPDDLPSIMKAEERWVRACHEAIKDVADEFLGDLSRWPDRLWLSVAALVVVAGPTGRAAIDEIIADAAGRIPLFGAVGLLALGDLIKTGEISPEHIEALIGLDVDLADFIEHEGGPAGLDTSLNSYFIDMLVERISETQGGGTEPPQ